MLQVALCMYDEAASLWILNLLDTKSIPSFRTMSSRRDHTAGLLHLHLLLATDYECSICNIYNMGKRELPDIYALARGRGHIYQANPDCTCYK